MTARKKKWTKEYAAAYNKKWREEHKEHRKAYQKAYQPKWYAKNKEEYLLKRKAQYKEKMYQWWNWLESIGRGSCVRCGYDEHPRALDFHHIDPSHKKFRISNFIDARGFSDKNKKELLEELKKCIVLCANCHRLEHSDYWTEWNQLRERKV